MTGLLLACAGGVAPVEPTVALPEAAEKTTFAGVAALGSFHLQASVRRSTARTGTPGKESLETMDIRWADPDHWSYVSGRDAVVVSDVRVWDAVAWVAAADGRFQKKGDPESRRIQLATVWEPWSWGLGRLGSDITQRPGAVELVDGRRSIHHLLSLGELEKGHRTWIPTNISGDVWIDEAAAVRTRARVHIEATSDQRSQVIDLLFTLDGIGSDPVVLRP